MNLENFENDQFIWNSEAFPQKSNPEEDIILIVRQDVAVLILRFISIAIIFLFFLLVKFLAQFVIPSNLDFILKMIDFCVSLASIGLLLYLIRYVHNFYLSLQLVTTDRVIDIDQKGIFKREVNEMAISNIQDVTYKQNGLLPSLLGYGEVVIKTSSLEIGSNANSIVGGFVFENCPEPSKVAGIISDLFHKNEANNYKQGAVATADELRKVLGDVGNTNNKPLEEENPIDEIIF